MNLGALLGEMLQQGMAGPAQSRMQRGASQSGGGIEQVLGALLGGGGQGGARGGGIGDLLGAVLGGAQGGGSSGRSGGGAQRGTGIDAMGSLGRAAPGQGGGGGGLADLLGAALGGAQGAQRGGGQMGGQPGGQPSGGGLADLLGAAMGGGGQRGGATGGAAMAVLGGLAMSALKNFAGQPAAAAQAIAPQEARALVDADAEALVLSAMISAMKADGAIDEDEVAKLEGHLNRDGVTRGEIDFVHAEMAKPVDVTALAARARTPASAAQVYAASIVATTIDTEPERAYLRALARALRLDDSTVARLHQMTGAPAV